LVFKVNIFFGLPVPSLPQVPKDFWPRTFFSYILHVLSYISNFLVICSDLDWMKCIMPMSFKQFCFCYMARAVCIIFSDRNKINVSVLFSFLSWATFGLISSFFHVIFHYLHQVTASFTITFSLTIHEKGAY